MTRREGILATLAVLLGLGWASTLNLPSAAEVEPAHMPSTIRILKRQEGFRGEPYKDQAGNLTIGYGTKIPIDEAEGLLLLNSRLAGAEEALAVRWHPYRDQPEHVKQALCLMAYQLGVEGELQFKKMLACLERGDTHCAAREAMASEWQHQTPQRVAVVAALLER